MSKYICNNCGVIFSEPYMKKFSELVEAWGVCIPREYEETYCPNCGDEDFEDYLEPEDVDEDE